MSSSCGSDTDASLTDLDQEEYEEDHDSKENERILQRMSDNQGDFMITPIQSEQFTSKPPRRPQYKRSASVPSDVRFHKFKEHDSHRSPNRASDDVDGAAAKTTPKSASTKSHKKSRSQDDAQSANLTKSANVTQRANAPQSANVTQSANAPQSANVTLSAQEKRSAMRKGASLQRQLATIESESDSDMDDNRRNKKVGDNGDQNNEHVNKTDSEVAKHDNNNKTASIDDVCVDLSTAKQTSHNNNNDILASQSEHSNNTSSTKSADSSEWDKSGDQSQSETRTTDKTKKTRRKLPEIPKTATVIQYASPYEDSSVTDVQEQIEIDDKHKAGHVNKAFQDSDPSDAKDRIIYDPATKSYENKWAKLRGGVVSSGRKSLDRNSNFNESTEESGKNVYLMVISVTRM